MQSVLGKPIRTNVRVRAVAPLAAAQAYGLETLRESWVAGNDMGSVVRSYPSESFLPEVSNRLAFIDQSTNTIWINPSAFESGVETAVGIASNSAVHLRAVVAHELAHVAQWEYWGGFKRHGASYGDALEVRWAIIEGHAQWLARATLTRLGEEEAAEAFTDALHSPYVAPDSDHCQRAQAHADVGALCFRYCRGEKFAHAAINALGVERGSEALSLAFFGSRSELVSPRTWIQKGQADHSCDVAERGIARINIDGVCGTAVGVEGGWLQRSAEVGSGRNWLDHIVGTVGVRWATGARPNSSFRTVIARLIRLEGAVESADLFRSWRATRAVQLNCIGWSRTEFADQAQPDDIACGPDADGIVLRSASVPAERLVFVAALDGAWIIDVEAEGKGTLDEAKAIVGKICQGMHRPSDSRPAEVPISTHNRHAPSAKRTEVRGRLDSIEASLLSDCSVVLWDRTGCSDPIEMACSDGRFSGLVSESGVWSIAFVRSMSLLSSGVSAEPALDSGLTWAVNVQFPAFARFQPTDSETGRIIESGEARWVSDSDVPGFATRNSVFAAAADRDGALLVDLRGGPWRIARQILVVRAPGYAAVRIEQSELASAQIGTRTIGLRKSGGIEVCIDPDSVAGAPVACLVRGEDALNTDAKILSIGAFSVFDRFSRNGESVMVGLLPGEYRVSVSRFSPLSATNRIDRSVTVVPGELNRISMRAPCEMASADLCLVFARGNPPPMLTMGSYCIQQSRGGIRESLAMGCVEFGTNCSDAPCARALPLGEYILAPTYGTWFREVRFVHSGARLQLTLCGP